MKVRILLIFLGYLALASADFRDDALRLTNEYRARHGAGPLSQDGHANWVAQAYAEKLARENKFEHSGNGKYGENLYGYWGPDKGSSEAARNAVSAWYSEVNHYDYSRPDFSMKTGHFTALVWKNTRAQGIGVARNPHSGFTVVVANYSPPGNFMGQFAENVGRG